MFQIVQIQLPNLCIVMVKMVGITGVSTCFGISIISRLFLSVFRPMQYHFYVLFKYWIIQLNW